MTKDFDVISENPIDVEESGEGKWRLSSLYYFLRSQERDKILTWRVHHVLS